MTELPFPIVIDKWGQPIAAKYAHISVFNISACLSSGSVKRLPVPFKKGKKYGDYPAGMCNNNMWHVGKILYRKNGQLVQNWILHGARLSEMSWATAIDRADCGIFCHLCAGFMLYQPNLCAWENTSERWGWYQLACNRQWWTSFLHALSILDKCWPIANFLGFGKGGRDLIKVDPRGTGTFFSWVSVQGMDNFCFINIYMLPDWAVHK